MKQIFQRLAVAGFILLLSTTAASAISAHRSKNLSGAEFTKTLVAGSHKLQEPKVKTRSSSPSTTALSFKIKNRT